jgi:hypothetical protein
MSRLHKWKTGQIKEVEKTKEKSQKEIFEEIAKKAGIKF